MTTLTKRALPLVAALVATPALAHPGGHASIGVAARALHVMTDPWHLGVALAVALGFVALTWRRRAYARGSRR